MQTHKDVQGSEIPENLINEIGKRMTLSMVRMGCDKINFKILNTIPNTIKGLMKEFKLTKMPMNRRVNELEKVGLLKRNRWLGEVEPTPLTIKLIETVNKMKVKIKAELPNLPMKFI